jgi:multicomponent Na+:H+ antiporter subunit E
MTASIRLPMLVIWLTALWVALWADFTVGNVIGGLLVALAVVVVARPTGVTGFELGRFRPIAAVVYGVYFLGQLVSSSLFVAWEILTPGSGLNRAIIAVPMHTTSDALVTLVANSITLTPGTATIDVRERDDGGPPTLYVHVLHFRDVESVRSDVLRLERLAVRAFGSADALRAVSAQPGGDDDPQDDTQHDDTQHDDREDPR